MTVEVIVHREGLGSETIEVSRAVREAGEVKLNGINPSDQSIIGSDLTWLSGSLGDPRSWEDLDYQKFPLVVVPVDDDSEYRVEIP